MKDPDPYDQGQSLQEAEEHGSWTQEEEPESSAQEEKEDSLAQEEEEQERSGVPGWPKSWPKWLVWLFSAACFWFAMNGVTLIRNCNKELHRFDGVEEAGFHEETTRPGAGETIEWILDTGGWKKEGDGTEEDGYYHYYLSKSRILGGVPSEQESESSVCLRSKTPITVQGSAKCMKIEGHRVGHITVRYKKGERRSLYGEDILFGITPVYAVDRVSFGSYMDLKYPLVRTETTDMTRQAEGLTVTLEKIEFRKGLTLCFFRMINEREDGKSAQIRETPGASFRDKAVQADLDEYIMDMDAAGTPSLRVEVMTWNNTTSGVAMTYLTYRLSVPENTIKSTGSLLGNTDPDQLRLVGAVALEEIEGEGELKIQLPVEVLLEEKQTQTVPFEFTYTVRGK